MKKTSTELCRAVRYWQHALRLDDWELAFREAGPNELEERDHLASVEIFAATKQAIIVLPSLSEFSREAEESLVHEMIHLVFAQMSLWVGSRDELDQILSEQGINTVTRLLVRLHHGEK